MTDAPARSPADIRYAVERRLRGRYRSEARFRVYGVAAIVVAALSLAVLLSSVISRGWSAFYIHELTLTVEAPASIDPNRTGDPQTIRRANYGRILQDAVIREFPNVTGREDLLDLFGLYNRLNGPVLMSKVLEKPSLVGTTFDFTMPISDDVDLYLKGRATKRERFAGEGRLSPSDVEGDIDLSSTRNDFAVLLAEVKARLARDAETLEVRAAAAARRADAAEASGVAGPRRAEADALAARAADLRARAAAPGAEETLTRETPSLLVYVNGGVVKLTQLSNDVARGRVLVPLDSRAASAAGEWRVDKLLTPEADRRIKDDQIAWTEELRARGRVSTAFNTILFSNASSTEPELAGVRGALIGSIFTMFVTMLMAVPIGVATAVYLEEFAPKNRWTDVIEVNINNLAAVPSIIFGLLGLAVFLNFFDLPRSAPLVGGMVLALMTLPTVIISTRSSLKAVPPSIRAGALAVGASKVQSVFHHVVPLALPGIMTGSIIGLAQALGETAPLLMIGMVAFVADVPSTLTSPSTVMPVQIYLWSDSAERAFEARTAAAIMVLLFLMVVLNLAAVFLRRRFERRW